MEVDKSLANKGAARQAQVLDCNADGSYKIRYSSEGSYRPGEVEQSVDPGRLSDPFVWDCRSTAASPPPEHDTEDSVEYVEEQLKILEREMEDLPPRARHGRSLALSLSSVPVYLLPCAPCRSALCFVLWLAP